MLRLFKELFHSVHPVTYLVLTFAIFTVPISWVIAWLVAGLIHELGHYIAITLLGKRIYGMRICWNGIVLETEELERKRWICALAGPLAGAVLIFFCRWFPRLAVCAFVQSAVNLLPIFPADGGQFVFGMLSLWLSYSVAKRITLTISAVLVVLLLLAALYILFEFSGKLVSLCLLMVLLAKLARIRFSCKDDRILVQ